jgi:uncharacterized membrane protein
MQSGPYAQYPHPKVREIDFGVISEGFSIVTKNLAPFVIAGILMVVVIAGIEFGMMFFIISWLGAPPTSSTDTDALMSYAAREYAVIIPGSFVMMGAIAPILMSFTMMTMKHIRGEQIVVGDFALGFTKWWQSVAIMVLNQIGAFIGVLGCGIGSIWVSGRLMLGLSACADKSSSPTEALRESWELTGPHMWMAMLFYFVISMLSGLGFIACCVGIFVTLPMMYVCFALVYRDLSGMMERTPNPVYETPAPPSDPL